MLETSLDGERAVKALWQQPIFAIATRKIGNWTPGDLASVDAQLEGGSLALCAQLCADIMRNPTVRGVLSTRTLGMLGLPLAWSGPEPSQWADLAPESELNKLLAWGLMLGVSIGHIKPDGSLEAWPMQWARKDPCTFQWYVQTISGEIEIDPSDGEWVIFTPYGVHEPWNEGLWAALAIPFLVEQYAINDRARASEVFGSAMVVGTPAEGATEAQRRKWLADLKNLSRSSRLVLPEGYKLELLEAQGQTWGIYQQAIEWAENSMIIAIAGQVVTTQGQSGFSNGGIHEAIAHSLIKFGARTFGACLASQYVRHVWSDESTPEWDITSPAVTKASAEALALFGEALTRANKALHDYGVKVNARELAKTYGVSLVPRFDESAGVVIQFAPTDIARMVTLNEGRASMGLKAKAMSDGTRDPKGDLLLSDITPPSQEAGPSSSNALVLRAASARPFNGARFANAIDVSDAPPEFRLFEEGRNDIDGGPAYFTEKSAKLVIRARGNRDCMVDLEHLSLVPESVNYDPDARGSYRLEVRNGELWAVTVRWTADGRERIESKKQRYVSPAFFTNARGEITSLINVALTALPAMHNTPPLIAARTNGEETIMLPPELLEMLGLPEDATLEDAMARIGEILRASAAVADDAGAKATADAAATAADAADDAAAVAADEPAAAEGGEPAAAAADADTPPDSDDDDEGEKSIAATALRQVAKLTKRLDAGEKLRLLSSRAFTPGVKKWLASQSVGVIKSYIAANPVAPRTLPRGSTAGQDGLNEYELELCRLTNCTHDEFKAARTIDAANDKARRLAVSGGVS